MTEIFHFDDEGVRAAATLLCAGNIVALPTETVYGLAANALDADAVAKVYEAKGRPSDNPLIVHVAEVGDVSRVAMLDGCAAGLTAVDHAETAAARGGLRATVRLLAERFWPGPLTLVLPRREVIPDVVTAGLGTVAVRVPAHPAFLAVLRESGLVLAAPSANVAGSPSPTTAAHVLDDMSGRIPAVLDGGPSEVGVESTVLDLTCSPPRLLRPGGVGLDALRAVLGRVDVDPAIEGEIAADARPGSPGMKYRHYAPGAEVYVVEGEADEAASRIASFAAGDPPQMGGAALLVPEEEVPLYAAAPGFTVATYGSLADPASMARGLFGALRSLDRPDVACIYARVPSGDDGVTLAVRNRLMKAAGFRVI